jgi:hypothetical protein
MRGDVTRTTFDAGRHATSVRKQQGRVDLDADWNEQQDIEQHLRLTSLRDVVGAAGAPVDAAAFALSVVTGELRLSPGLFYVDGLVCENDSDVAVLDQPDLPAGLPRVQRADGTWLTPTDDVPPGVYLAHVDVWSQLRTVVEEPALREVALGGPDTATRVRTVWQVRLVEAGVPGSTPPCSVAPAAWTAYTAPSTGTLAAWADPTGAPVGDCDVPLASPYRGLDNRTYRVEVREGGAPGTATVVWSRDNGSVTATWDGATGPVLTVRTPGRDAAAGFAPGTWVELTDDRAELQGLPGTLVRVATSRGDLVEVDPSTATGTLDHAQFSGHPKVRRWDGTAVVPSDGSELELELGIRVRFGTGSLTYRTGDHWSFAARAATHDVEWPEASGAPAALLPAGPRHRFARLGLVSWNGSAWTVVRDCRPLFAPLADQVHLSRVGGDAQEAVPDVATPATRVPLPLPLEVGVTSGDRPVAGATVEFTVTTGTGELAGTGTTVRVSTGAGGLAATTWAVDSTTGLQAVTARLLGPDGVTPRSVPVRFTAWLQRADTTSYDPAASPSLSGAVTVQQAIDRLAATTGGGCSTLTLSPGDGWADALRQLPERADAVVCLRPGEYRTDKAVRLAQLGHVVLHGGGAATRIVVAEGEAGLVFEGCASVTVHDLAVAVERYPTAPEADQLGVLTALDCREVSLSGLEVACPPDLSVRGACVTVRGSAPNADGRARPVDAVRVVDCTFRVGHGQSGVLVVDALDTQVRGNRFAVVPLRTTPTYADIVADPVRLAHLANQLMGGVVVDRRPESGRGGFTTLVPVGGWVVRMNSAVPEREWRRLLAEQPPGADDVTSSDGVRAYVEGVAAKAVEQPAVLPAFERTLHSLRAGLGAEASRLLETETGRSSLRGLLTGGAVDVAAAADVAPVRRAVSLRAGDAWVRFDSPLSQSTWEAVLADSPVRGQTPVAVLRALRSSVRRLLTDEAFGERHAAAFRKAVRGRAVASGHCAVVVAGAVLGTAEVGDNAVLGFAEGVRIAGSTAGRRPAPVVARSVRVRGNDISLAPPVDRAAARRGVLVGNAERCVVTDNAVRVGGSREALVGVLLAGTFGPHLVVRDNTADGCQQGVRIDVRGERPARALWVAADNLALGSSGGPAVEAPAAVRRTGNVPA